MIAIPNPHFPPPDEALALADEILPDLDAVLIELNTPRPPSDDPSGACGVTSRSETRSRSIEAGRIAERFAGFVRLAQADHG